MDCRVPIDDTTNTTLGCKRPRANFVDSGKENIDPAERIRQKKREKYASLTEEEKEKKHAKARENY